uniref:Uncharacterized protein n=2 Tax=Cacopsylla melanoneura TaxID=428564 RepID=A0A8D9BCC1_9HEMI
MPDIKKHPAYIKVLEENKKLKLEISALKNELIKYETHSKPDNQTSTKTKQKITTLPKPSKKFNMNYNKTLTKCVNSTTSKTGPSTIKDKKYRSETSNTSPTQNNKASTSKTSVPTPPCKQIEKPHKLVILSDSMGRGLAQELSVILPRTQVTGYVYPNAKFNDVVKCAEELCTELTKSDFVFILCGTNNTHDLAPASTPYFNMRPIKSLQEKTNVILSAIPFRYDGYCYQNTNICWSNEYLFNKCQELNVNFISCNVVLKRPHFTRHGLHMNSKGKCALADKVKCFILPYLLGLGAHSNHVNINNLSCLTDVNLADISCPFDADDSLLNLTSVSHVLNNTFQLDSTSLLNSTLPVISADESSDISSFFLTN